MNRLNLTKALAWAVITYATFWIWFIIIIIIIIMALIK